MPDRRGVMSRYMLIALLLTLPQYSRAADVWHRVKAENETDSWRVVEGDAEVTVNGERFVAQLFAKGSHENPQISLKGNIKADRIIVVEIVVGTDGPAATYKGSLRKSKWRDGAEYAGVETITLTDGWSVIGLTRAIKR